MVKQCKFIAIAITYHSMISKYKT